MQALRKSPVSRFAYLVLNFGALTCALLLARYYLKPHKRLKPGGSFGRQASVLAYNNFGLSLPALGWALCIVSLPFIAWDVLAAGSHWYFNGHYTLGVHFLSLPVEELLFFICIPLVCVVLFEMIIQRTTDIDVPVPMPEIWVRALHIGLVITAATLLYAFNDRGYTQLVMFAMLVALLFMAWQGTLVRTRAFWVFQPVLLALFLFGNTWLTWLPIVAYNPEAIIGLRLGTIPIEDFFYNFSFVNLFVLAYVTRHGRYSLNPKSE